MEELKLWEMISKSEIEDIHKKSDEIYRIYGDYHNNSDDRYQIGERQSDGI